MPGPPKQFDRQSALLKSMDVFWSRGFNGTSIEDLVSAVGINRSSMYATFGGKEQLFLEALQLYADLHLDDLRSKLEGRGSPLTRLRRALRYMGRKLYEDGFRGCFAGNTATELGVDSGPASAIVQQMIGRGRTLMTRVLDDAVLAGELAADLDTAATATFIFTFMQGLSVVSQAGMPARETDRQIDMLLQTLPRGPA